MLSGPDLSENNGSADFAAIAKEHELVFVRTNDGDHHDALYGKRRVEEIRKAKLTWGPYAYARVASPANGERTGAEECAMVLEFAREGGWKHPGDLPLTYDFESDNGQGGVKAGRHLMQFVRAYVHSIKGPMGLYTMPGFWAAVFPHLSAGERDYLRAHTFLWEASWGVSHPQHLDPWPAPTIHQFTDRGSCPGVHGGVDLNRVLIGADAFRRLAGGHHPHHGPPSDGGTKAPPAPPMSHHHTPAPKKHHRQRPHDAPKSLPRRFWHHWRFPWGPRARNSGGFKDWCWAHGFLSPHFSRAEWACHDGTAIPESLRSKAQRHAFNMERLRHELGDIPIPTISPYRDPAYNAKIGGATLSEHMDADATDHSKEWVDGVGRSRFMAACEKVFANGGLGIYPWGAFHVDSRGYRARWSSW
jgi:GH25 family lysozyme M1 (1,4-beta-N-acetylmuramidase)